MKLEVEVTREDWRKGRAADCSHCPVARAVIRALRRKGGRRIEPTKVEVGADRVDLMGDARRYKGDFRGVTHLAVVPEHVGDMIQAFDSGRAESFPVERFELEFVETAGVLAGYVYQRLLGDPFRCQEENQADLDRAWEQIQASKDVSAEDWDRVFS